MEPTDLFWQFVNERETVRKLKESGAPKPWTSDPVLQSEFFCNVFREDDKTTRWFAKNVRNKVAHDPAASIQACAAFRWFNLIETGEVIKDWLIGDWNPIGVKNWLQPRRERGDKLFGSAYIISSPLGDPKLDWAIARATDIIEKRHELAKCKSLREMHTELVKFQGIGPFMAYEIVTDLRHTSALRDAPDILTWASPGPGCARGLGWLHGDKTKFRYGSKRDRAVMIEEMFRLLVVSPLYWNHEREWEMREVEHCLCEFDKWCRATFEGKRTKRGYAGS